MRRILVLIAALFVLQSHAALKLGTPFTDNAVLQRETKVAIWGWDAPGTKIQIEASWGATASAKAGPDGKWTTTLKTRKAGGPHTLTVKGSETLTRTNVLLGEVWLCAGQSNMEWTMGHHAVQSGKVEIAQADFPNIRLLLLPNVSAAQPAATANAAWRTCSPQTVGDFSAVGYFYGRALHDDLKVPVGLIDVAWGGTEVEAWIPREGFAQVKSLAEHLDPAVAKACTEDHKKRKVNDAGHRAGVLYNGLVAPIIPYGIRGAIWYQGESNVQRAKQYNESFPLMISEWRRVWDQGNFPFYFVQIAPFTGYNDGAGAELREAQLNTYRKVKNTGLAVITDIAGDVGNIHPQNKQDVGRRLARWALTETYDKDVVVSGPLFRSAKVEKSAIRVRFEFAEGLNAAGGPLKEFTIAGADGKFVEAQAAVDGETVVVSAASVPEPRYVRFAWRAAPKPNLFNGAGLPASPFRSDNLPGVTDKEVW